MAGGFETRPLQLDENAMVGYSRYFLGNYTTNIFWGMRLKHSGLPEAETI